MAAENIGTVKSGTGRTWYVRWDASSGEVYCGLSSGGENYVGKASSAAGAMRKAEAYAYKY